MGLNPSAEKSNTRSGQFAPHLKASHRLLILKAEVSGIGVRIAETWTSILKIWRCKFGISHLSFFDSIDSVMVDASQSFHFFGRLSSYKSLALVMFVCLLAFQPWRRRLLRRRPHTGRQRGGGGRHEVGRRRFDLHPAGSHGGIDRRLRVHPEYPTGGSIAGAQTGRPVADFTLERSGNSPVTAICPRRYRRRSNTHASADWPVNETRGCPDVCQVVSYRPLLSIMATTLTSLHPSILSISASLT
jgi:hypothetical protein